MGYQNNKIEKLKRCIQGKFDVYVDVSNVTGSLQNISVKRDHIPDHLKHCKVDELMWVMNYKKLKDCFEQLGDLNNIYFYTPQFEGTHQDFRNFLRIRLGFQIISKPLKKYVDGTQKANFDVEIATDMQYNINNYQTAILFSGDCDFEYLVKFLRQQEKTIIGFSHRESIAKELPPVLSYYFDIFDFREVFLEVKTRKNPKE